MHYSCKWTVSADPVEQKVGDRTVFSAVCDGNTLRLGFAYDVKDEPLPMQAAAVPGDTAELTIRPYRLELRINGALLDEEWPFGEPLYTPETIPKLHAEVIPPEDLPALPSVTRTFEGVDGMCIPGVNVGDCMPYNDETGEGDRVYHLFWLYDRHHHQSKWMLGAHQWAHCSTRDLVHWEEHPMAVGITDPMEGSICTGSVIHAGDTYYAWYAQRMSDHSPARLTCAISKDCYHFTKRGDYFSLPDAYETTSARDPKVVEWNGQYHMLVTTTEIATGQGCLAHLISEDMVHWEDAGIVMRASDTAQPECPDWFHWNGKFYLLAGVRGGSIYMVSDEPFSGFEFPDPEILPSRRIPCGRVPKSALLNGRRIFMGFVADVTTYGGPLISVEAFQNPDGTLRFEPLTLA